MTISILIISGFFILFLVMLSIYYDGLKDEKLEREREQMQGMFNYTLEGSPSVEEGRPMSEYYVAVNKPNEPKEK